MAGKREFSRAHLSRLADKNNLHLLIHGKVYNAQTFVNEHPGGDLVLLGEGGKDATKAWEDVQHSEEAKELMKDYLVGYCIESPQTSTSESSQITANEKSRLIASQQPVLALLSIFLAILLGVYWQAQWPV
ncbi:hypothetical protein ASPVEDRAFT_148835 [Aspergillus versicolor CBS 583.65]|uniref:Cytochrome b5 heme-binding domain-containing protein n=1 Tax=Aspergillus versicolor CBS 583.65 TaxID=1036611 RepID=A0A1L9PEA8_ASPVE|nr:uncharacterized protein ASPVEDRAFT_148835 [Aspergillus versicolor CBS 583.65]OJI99839.1 hypothetical protein ASPVEDRAFT_148835 [Aspergillus versicolor CBS 583.65]